MGRRHAFGELQTDQGQLHICEKGAISYTWVALKGGLNGRLELYTYLRVTRFTASPEGKCIIRKF